MVQLPVTLDDSALAWEDADRIFDGEDILFEYDVSNQLVNRYTHGPGIDEPLVLERDTNADGVTDTAFVYHADGLGSITELTDSAGTVVQAYTYNAFGEIQATLDPSFVQPFTFTARELDPETGLYYYRARTYDPSTGRFLQEDPFRGILDLPQSLNKYPYTANNPITFTDPFGLQDGLAGVTTGGALATQLTIEGGLTLAGIGFLLQSRPLIALGLGVAAVGAIGASCSVANIFERTEDTAEKIFEKSGFQERMEAIERVEKE